MTPEQATLESARLEGLSARDRLAWAAERWGDALLFTSSFGPGSGALLHLWSEVARELPVYFIDTGFLFDETLAYRDLLRAQLGPTVVTLRPADERAEIPARLGLPLYGLDPHPSSPTLLRSI